MTETFTFVVGLWVGWLLAAGTIWCIYETFR